MISPLTRHVDALSLLLARASQCDGVRGEVSFGLVRNDDSKIVIAGGNACLASLEAHMHVHTIWKHSRVHERFQQEYMKGYNKLRRAKGKLIVGCATSIKYQWWRELPQEPSGGESCPHDASTAHFQVVVCLEGEVRIRHRAGANDWTQEDIAACELGVVPCDVTYSISPTPPSVLSFCIVAMMMW